MPAVSRRQARFLGLIASGKTPRKRTSLTPTQAREFLRGQKVGSLPERARNPVVRRARRTR